MNDMRQAIIEYIKSNGNSTFAELQYHLQSKGYNTKGDQWFSTTFAFEYNVILWFEVSEEFCDTLGKLRKENIIDYEPTNAINYLITGAIPNMPVVKSVKKYKKPHWLPVEIVLTQSFKDLIEKECI